MDSYVPVRIAYNSFNPLKGDEAAMAPFIFLHGITSCKETWGDIPQTVADATRRKAYALDARNHGDSEWNDNFTVKDVVQDVLHFMDSMNITKAILIGHSMGGKVAMNLALKKPEKVELLVVEEMFVKKLPQSLLDFTLAYTTLAPEAISLVPSEADEATAMETLINFVSTAMTLGKPEHQNCCNFDISTIAMKRTSEGCFTLKANMSVLEDSIRKASESSDQEEGVYKGPTCFIYGKMSPFEVDKDADNIRKYFPKAKFIGIENSSHSVHRDNPRDYIKELLDFVTKNSGESRMGEQDM